MPFNTFSNKLEDADNRRESTDADVKYIFPIYYSGFFFKASSFVVDLRGKKGIDRFEAHFPVGFSILGTTSTSITYGIVDEVEIKYTHPSLKRLKAEVTVKDASWRDINFLIDSEMDVDSTIFGASPSAGLDHSIGQLKFINNDKSLELIIPDDVNVTLGWGMQGGQGRITYQLDNGVGLPYTYDPTVDTDSTGTIRFEGKKHVARMSQVVGGGSEKRIWLFYQDSGLYAHEAYSDDGGSTWTEAAISTAQKGVSVALDGNDRICLLYTNWAGNLSLYEKAGTSGVGSWSSTSIFNGSAQCRGMDIDVGSDNKWQCVLVYANDTPATKHEFYYVNEDMSFPQGEGDDKVGENVRNISGSDPHENVQIAMHVDANNDAHICWFESDSDSNWTNIVEYVKRVYSTGSYVNTQTIYSDTSATDTVRHCNIFVDIYDNVYVSFTATAAHTYAKCRRCHGAVWQSVEDLNDDDGAGTREGATPYFEMDATGLVYAVFVEEDLGSQIDLNLCYRTFNPTTTTWSPLLANNPTEILDEAIDHVYPMCVHSWCEKYQPASGMGMMYFNNTNFDIEWVEISGTDWSDAGGGYSAASGVGIAVGMEWFLE